MQATFFNLVSFCFGVFSSSLLLMQKGRIVYSPELCNFHIEGMQL